MAICWSINWSINWSTHPLVSPAPIPAPAAHPRAARCASHIPPHSDTPPGARTGLAATRYAGVAGLTWRDPRRCRARTAAPPHPHPAPSPAPARPARHLRPRLPLPRRVASPLRNEMPFFVRNRTTFAASRRVTSSQPRPPSSCVPHAACRGHVPRAHMMGHGCEYAADAAACGWRLRPDGAEDGGSQQARGWDRRMQQRVTAGWGLRTWKSRSSQERDDGGCYAINLRAV